MKRLKYRIWFGGYSYPAILAVLAAPLAGYLSVYCLRNTLKTLSLPQAFALIFGISAAAFFLCLLPFFLWYHRLSGEDRIRISQAEPPEWRGITEEERAAVRRTKGSRTGLLLAPGIILFCGIMTYIEQASKGNATRNVLFWSMVPVLCIAAAILIVSLLVTGFWRSINETAEAAELTVDHCFTRIVRRKNRKAYRHFAVCYLPDGKYLFRIDREQTDTVTVIRWKKQYCILTPPPDDKEYGDLS